MSFALLLPLLGTACEATCEDACQKLIDDCEAGIPSYSVKQCSDDCNAVETSYEAYDYLQPQLEALQNQLNCIDDSSCEDITNPDAPACYDEQLSVF
jgi:hypothetical protein